MPTDTKPSNGHGGARPGAGRPRKPPQLIDLSETFNDPLEFLRAVMNDTTADIKVRADAAKAMLAYTHARKTDAGKKEERQAKAEAVASKFAPRQPPRLVKS